MIGIWLRIERNCINQDCTEAHGQWSVNTPVTKEEYERFLEEMDKAKNIAKQIYLTTNGIKEEEC